MASFDIFMQHFYKLQQGNAEKVTVYVTQVQQEYPTMLSVSEVKKHFRDHLFHGLHKQLCDSMCYLYDDMGKMYPQLMTAACKAESEEED